MKETKGQSVSVVYWAVIYLKYPPFYWLPQEKPVSIRPVNLFFSSGDQFTLLLLCAELCVPQITQLFVFTLCRTLRSANHATRRKYIPIAMMHER